MITFKQFDNDGGGVFLYLFFEQDTAYCINQQLYYDWYLSKED